MTSVSSAAPSITCERKQWVSDAIVCHSLIKALTCFDAAPLSSRIALGSIKSLNTNYDPAIAMGPPIDSILKNKEKKYLLMVERGDYNGVRKYAHEHCMLFI